MVVSKRGKLSGEWRKLSNLELYNLYSSPDIVKGDQMVLGDKDTVFI
jgi:hypothetical protein